MRISFKMRVNSFESEFYYNEHHNNSNPGQSPKIVFFYPPR